MKNAIKIANLILSIGRTKTVEGKIPMQQGRDCRDDIDMTKGKLFKKKGGLVGGED
jgi:hypothetical protein